jgi:hypothetical protein
MCVRVVPGMAARQTCLDFATHGRGWVVGPKRVYDVGRCGLGKKNITFFVETLPKLRFLWSFHLFSHHATLRTTGKPTFAERQNVCRAFYIGRTTKKLFAVRFLYSARQRKNARQISSLQCARTKRTAKILFAVRFLHNAQQSIFPSPTVWKTRHNRQRQRLIQNHDHLARRGG